MAPKQRAGYAVQVIARSMNRMHLCALLLALTLATGCSDQSGPVASASAKTIDTASDGNDGGISSDSNDAGAAGADVSAAQDSHATADGAVHRGSHSDATTPANQDAANHSDTNACNTTQCDDGNPCTDDSCSAGQCANLPNAATCNDDDACTTGEKCAAGKCTAKQALACDDNNPCTSNACDKAKGCQHAPRKDGTNCTGGFCKAGTCAPLGPCSGKKDGDACEDGNKCTEKEACNKGACVGEKIVCDDKQPCTKDACAPASGCTVTHAPGPCDDGSDCTKDDVCKGGKCAPGKLDCNDNNACTLDACESNKCAHDHTNNGSKCEDGDACTKSDACNAGTCVAGKAVACDDNNLCTSDACDSKTGTCSHLPEVAKSCFGGVCTSNAKCNAKGACEGTLVSCDDGNACTVDSCETQPGSSKITCSHAAAKGTAICGEVMRCTGTLCIAGGGGWGRAIAAGGSHNCAIRGCGKTKPCITQSGAAWCWGQADKGQTGAPPSNVATTQPAQIKSPMFKLMAAGEAFSCGIDDKSQTWCWGDNSKGQLSLSHSKPGSGKPTKALRTGGLALTDNNAIAAGKSHACSLMSGGWIHCWGANESGQLGQGGNWAKTELAKLALLPKAKRIAAAANNTCLVALDGTIFCVGDGSRGQLGDGKKSNSSAKGVKVAGLKDPLLLRGGRGHFCALRDDRKVACWGAGDKGQNGGGGKDLLSPQVVQGLPPIFALATGGDTSCALDGKGACWCWGAGSSKQNGNKNAVATLTPQKLSGAPFYMVSLGSKHGCGLELDGGIMCWGDNLVGQVGLGVSGGAFHLPQPIKTSSP